MITRITARMRRCTLEDWRDEIILRLHSSNAESMGFFSVRRNMGRPRKGAGNACVCTEEEVKSTSQVLGGIG